MSETPRDSGVATMSLSRSEWILAGLYVPVAVAMFLLVPTGHPLLILPAAVGMATYLLQRIIRLPLVDGYVSVVQPAFVVLLFALPLNVVAVLLPLGLFASTIVGDRSVRADRLPMALADAWYCVPPVLMLALFAPGRFLWHHWPVYVAALAAELAVSFIAPIIRIAIYREKLAIAPTVLFLPAAIDILLTPLGAAAAHAGTTAAEESGFILASVLVLVAALGHERKERLGYERLALRDGLTGLANRALFDELLHAAERRLGRSGDMSALLFIDVDNFKQVNDIHGHLAGDTVLKTTAVRIENVVRSVDTVARFGGDEFAVLLADLTNLEAVERVAGAIRRAVSEPIELDDGSTLTVTASIGVAVLGNETDPDAAVARADEAMYEAKQVAHTRAA